MKKSIVFSSVTGNTELLANEIKNKIGEVSYFGKPCDEALDADIIYIGSWTMANTCTPDIKEFISKINNKKVFLFVSCGYGSTDSFFGPVINSVKELVNETNEIIGEFICQGKVSSNKIEAIKKMDEQKYNNMKDELDNSQTHPDQNDISNLISKI